MQNYYNIITYNQISDQQYRFTLGLNPDCKVYEGHFPNMPIAPGACNIQMIKECVEQIKGCEVQFSAIKQCKFLQPIVPSNETLTLDIQLNDNNIDAILSQNGSIIMKLKSIIKNSK